MRRWRDLLRTPAAAEALFRRVCIEERSVLPARRFEAQRLVAWFGSKAPALQVCACTAQQAQAAAPAHR